MFTPKELELERGWPGRIDGDRVVQLAAQTLQAYFTGGGTAREHAEYPLAEVDMRAPVLRPPSVRVFKGHDFVFANPAAIRGPGEVVEVPDGAAEIQPVLRRAALIGADGAIGGFTLMNDWRAQSLVGAKRHDFAISLGPVVVTPDEIDDDDIDWSALVGIAARNTRLLPGDVLAAGADERDPVGAGAVVELALAPFGVLRNAVA
jgi:hypothetical protein